jgi:transposase-like protein
LTVVEDAQEARSASARGSAPDGATSRGSRRSRVSLDEQREIAALYADASVPTSAIRARFGIGESSLYRILQQHGVALRGHSGAATAPARKPAPAAKTRRKHAVSSELLGAATATTSVAERASATTRVARGRRARRTVAAAPRTPATSVAGLKVSSNGSKFRIRYLGERVFEAPNIQDALRQAMSLGATEVMAVAREN